LRNSGPSSFADIKGEAEFKTGTDGKTTKHLEKAEHKCGGLRDIIVRDHTIPSRSSGGGLQGVQGGREMKRPDSRNHRKKKKKRRIERKILGQRGFDEERTGGGKRNKRTTQLLGKPHSGRSQ